MALTPLPVDAHLPAIAAAVRERGALVLRAEPGAGKTTRVPPALLDAAPAGQEVLVLEPRRIAARLAARRVAEERGERAGETVGYQVRFEDVSSKATRLRFLTEGILARRLARDPLLRGVSTVVLDEFHERHIHGDLALALVAELRRTRRPDLRVVVMSATLDAGPIAAFLGDARGEAPVVDVKGRVFDVAVEFAGMEAREPLDERVAAAVDKVTSPAPVDSAAAARAPRSGGANDDPGDVLVFLPGAGEIAGAQAACARLARERGLVVLPLHGSLPPEEQDRALRPAAGRKVILATNVAETSVTIDGVSVVIDSGLARVAAHSPWSGLPTLKIEPVSRASAVQRAGRAGRTRPGRCLRLYTRRDFDMRPPFSAPEVERIDLAETLLTLAAAGVRDPATFRWFEAPPASALEGARTLLRRLGAVGPSGALTPTGERMLRFPLHPRLARVLVAAEDLGVGPEAAALAAVLSDDRRRLARLDDREARHRTEPARRQLERLLRREAKRAADPHVALEQALLAGHPDRVARRRKAGSEELLLFEGGTAKLARECDLPPDAEWLVALDAEQIARGPALVRLASPIEPDWILDLFADEVREVVEATWNAPAERVDVTERMMYGSLALTERRAADTPARYPEVEEALAKAALGAGPGKFADADELAAWLARVAFARTLAPDVVPALGDDDVSAALVELCAGRKSFAQLREAGLLGAIAGRLAPDARRALDRLAPEHVVLPGGRRVRVRYHAGRPPSIASRLQDFFGMVDGPRVGGGKVPLVLELLAPNQRPVQITTDLAGFWERHYPAIRRELSRRYPRHKWPEEPMK